MKNLPDKLHFVGIGGIGMSALAQAAAELGCFVTGSDRASESPENRRIFQALKKLGIRIFPQDGSRFRSGDTQPDALIYSTAIEEDNPDFAASQGIARLHRSEAMKLIVEKMHASITAVTGSCGKTTVSAWLAESLDRLGKAPSFLSGGLANHFTGNGLAGNAWHGSGELCVLEADESDKSLLHYVPDHTIVLNIGTDHYSKEELARVFREFLTNTRRTAVVEDSVLDAVGSDCVKGRNTAVFTTKEGTENTYQGFPLFRAESYEINGSSAFCRIRGQKIRLPSPGEHNAANAAAVFAMLNLLGCGEKESAEAMSDFSGVWRRFECHGKTSGGAVVYDDYAHNVEKICSCLEAAREITTGHLAVFFQPHGFGPFNFMRKDLLPALRKELRAGDLFGFLPVYYAGGTTSFRPTSEEVAAEYAETTPAFECRAFRDRAEAEQWTRQLKNGDVLVIMGARDNSLSDWAGELARKQ